MNVVVAERQAREYLQIAEDLMAEYGKLENIITEMRSAWRGSVSSMFAAKLDAYRTQLGKDAKKVYIDAVAFNKIVGIVIDTDQQIARKFAGGVEMTDAP